MFCTYASKYNSLPEILRQPWDLQDFYPGELVLPRKNTSSTVDRCYNNILQNAFFFQTWEGNLRKIYQSTFAWTMCSTMFLKAFCQKIERFEFDYLEIVSLSYLKISGVNIDAQCIIIPSLPHHAYQITRFTTLAHKQNTLNQLNGTLFSEKKYAAERKN